MTNTMKSESTLAGETGEPDPEALLRKGIGLHKANRLQEAKELYERVLELRPDHSQAIQYLGVIARRQGQIKRAVALMRRSLELDAEDPGCHHNLARALIDAGQTGEAVQVLERGLEKKPQASGLWDQLSVAHVQRKDFEQGIQAAHRAIELAPDSRDHHLRLAAALYSSGQLDEALAVYDRLIAQEPKDPNLQHSRGTVLKALGRMDAAANAYARAVELDPTTMDAWRARVDMRKFEPGDPDIARLETVFKSGRLTPAQRMTACFALGKIYEDVGQYNRAFWCFQEGNRLKRNTISFNINNVIQQHNEIRRTFDASLLERQRDLGEPDATPIFILGMPRSGTTLAEQILASHPDVFGAGELYDLSKICGETAREHGLQGPYPRWVPDLTPEAMRALGRRYVDRIRAGRPDRAHITDKMPSNYRFVGLIRLLLPNAKIIHMRRHPADTCLSCYTKLFAESQNHTYDLTELGRSYRAYEELMAHWRAVLPPDGMLEVQYERLVADPRTQIQRLLDFCGLPWADACLQFHRTKRGVSTASVSQVRRPLYTSSVQRWRRFADHLNPLFDALAAGYKESGPE